MISYQKNKKASLACVSILSVAALGLGGCIGGSSSSGGGGGGGGGGNVDIASAAEIYDGSYNGPSNLSAIDTPEAAAQAMDLAYLSSRVEAFLVTLEVLLMDEDADSGTIDGTRTDVDDAGQLVYSRSGSLPTFTETWTMKGDNGFCIEKIDTNGPMCIKGEVTLKETFETSGGEVTSGTAEMSFDELQVTFRGGKVEMTGKEVSGSDMEGETRTAMAIDIAFTSDQEKGIETEIRLLWDGLATGITDPDNFSRTIEMDIATPLLGGRIETLQTDTLETQESFDHFNCSDGISGDDYEDASSGRVTITTDVGEIVANLAENGNCEEFVVSGGPEGTFTLLDTLFTGIQGATE